MDTNCVYISYESTGYFQKHVIDYINNDEKLKEFYRHPVSIEGIKQAIIQRRNFNTPRNLLVDELRKQYTAIVLNEVQENNLESLLSGNTFTICTAHQPNIFTGPLYFIYKIIHVIKLADHLNKEFKSYKFVPVYYMGSEDADLDELGHVYINGEKHIWETKQSGAVGRMKVDKNFIQLIDSIAGQLEVLPFGKELIDLFRYSYKEGISIQQATLILVNELFKEFGLLVLIPDNANLKQTFNPIVKRELIEQFSQPLVLDTCNRLSKNYKTQAGGREINLFYLFEASRERIEKINEHFFVKELGLSWTIDEILAEVEFHPERFSANVILRPLFQETILPNVAFIGGGGEIAYWQELLSVFDACKIPYPVLVLRNSFLVVEKKYQKLSDELGFSISDLFQSDLYLQKKFTNTRSSHRLDMSPEIDEAITFYTRLGNHVAEVDATLKQHTEALKELAIKKLTGLEKKLFRKAKKQLDTDIMRLAKLKNDLFPLGSLQERKENFSLFYAKHGRKFIDEIMKNSVTLEQEFALLYL